jgi:hypothetical protein
VDVRTNGLVSVDDGWLHVHTRVDGGEVHVTAEVYESEPPFDLAGWEDVAEASVPAPDGCLTLDGVTIGAPDGYPPLSPAGPGDYRVRVHARGRDVPPWQTPESITEFYLLQVWPSTPAPPRVLSAKSAHSADLRAGDG